MTFQKGNTYGHGHGGRPKRRYELKVKCKELTPAIIKRLAKIIHSDEERARDQIAACNTVLAYGWGKAHQSVDVTQTYDITADFLRSLQLINNAATDPKNITPPNINAEKDLKIGPMPANQVIPAEWKV